MTRRTFETEDFRGITGWDRPLPYHFLEMYPRHRPALYPDPVYSNRLDHDDAAMSLEEIADTLRHYGIPTPEGLWRDLAEDQALNRRPLEVSYDAPERGAMTVRQADERSAEVEVFRDARWKPRRDGGWRLLGTNAAGRRLARQAIEGAGTPDHDLASGPDDAAEAEPPGEPDQDRLRDRIMDRIDALLHRLRDRFTSQDQGMDR